MASRRAVQQLRLRYGSSVSASASTLEAGVVFGVASRTSATRTSYTASNAILGVGRPAPTWLNGWRSGGIGHSVRCYSTGGQNQAPSSRIWAFEEIKKQVEAKNSKDNVVFVDVREPSELFDTGKIPGAINIPITSAIQSFHVSDLDFEDMYGFTRPPKDATLLFYCKAGVRARTAAALAQHAGWTSVGEYPGSWLDWEAHQGPVEKVNTRRKDGGEDNA